MIERTNEGGFPADRRIRFGDCADVALSGRFDGRSPCGGRRG